MATIKIKDLPKDQKVSEAEIKTITGGFTTLQTITSPLTGTSQTSLNPFATGGSIVAVAGVRG